MMAHRKSWLTLAVVPLTVWLPAVVLCAVTAAFFVWQTSESGGRRAQIRSQIEDLLYGDGERLSGIELDDTGAGGTVVCRAPPGGLLGARLVHGDPLLRNFLGLTTSAAR